MIGGAPGGTVLGGFFGFWFGWPPRRSAERSRRRGSPVLSRHTRYSGCPFARQLGASVGGDRPRQRAELVSAELHPAGRSAEHYPNRRFVGRSSALCASAEMKVASAPAKNPSGTE